MSALRQALEAYISLRRGLGAQLRESAAYLRRFVEFLEREGAETITTPLALRWALAPADATPATWARRLAEVRRFAKWLSATTSNTEVPPRALLLERCRRRPPYIYNDEEIRCILDEAARLPSPSGLRANTYATLFGLLAATGLRLGEALALDCDDVDLRSGILAVRHAKFDKSRFVPVHDSTRNALRRYAQQRDRILARLASRAFLLSERGVRLTQGSARYNFAVVSRATGLRLQAQGYHHGRGPRLHDMRHSLAASTLVRWYREGRDVERELPKLAAYLGHAHVSDTYWYIEAVPELLRLATERSARVREDTA
jgi:site-specific recombinase XerD